MKTLAAVLILAAVAASSFPSAAQVDDRRWIVQTSDGKIIGFTDDGGALAPTGATFVLDSVIRAADPPGATGEILPLGTWDADTSTYTAPSGGGIVVHIDPTTDTGGVQEACADMLDVFDAALDYIYENRSAWTDDARTKAVDGIHWQIVNSARVALNSTRTHARRQKFCEESASWPNGVNGEARQYVDAMGGNTPVNTKDWSWVNPTTDARTDVSGAATIFGTATNVENAPSSAKLIGRGWIADIP